MLNVVSFKFFTCLYVAIRIITNAAILASKQLTEIPKEIRLIHNEFSAYSFAYSAIILSCGLADTGALYFLSFIQSPAFLFFIKLFVQKNITISDISKHKIKKLHSSHNNLLSFYDFFHVGI